MPDRFRIEWAPIALGDLDEILEYIAARDSVDAAVHVYEKLRDRIERLMSRPHPQRCRIPPEFRKLGVTEYRELVVTPYGVFFRIRAKTVGIVGVLDRRRDLEELLLQRVLRS